MNLAIAYSPRRGFPSISRDFTTIIVTSRRKTLAALMPSRKALNPTCLVLVLYQSPERPMAPGAAKIAAVFHPVSWCETRLQVS